MHWCFICGSMFAYCIFLQQGQWHKTPSPKLRWNFTHSNCPYKIQTRVFLCSGIRRKKDCFSMQSSLQVTTSTWHPLLCRIIFWVWSRNDIFSAPLRLLTTNSLLGMLRNCIIAHCFLMTSRGFRSVGIRLCLFRQIAGGSKRVQLNILEGLVCFDNCNVIFVGGLQIIRL